MGNLSLSDIAVGVWSGHEVFSERIIPSLKTWMRFFPEVNIYTDYLPSDFDPNIIKNNSHVNVTIISTNRETHFVIGSYFDNPWIKVQPRHIENLYNLYLNHPNSKWYIALDDDSYPLSSSILQSLSKINESKMIVYGFHFFINPVDLKFFPIPSRNRLFSHGGSGIFLPSSLMKAFEPKMHDCLYMEGIPLMPSDVRLTRCLEEYFGSLKFQDNMLEPLPGTHPVHFFEDSPRNHDSPILTYHQVTKPYISLLSSATISEFTINDTDYYTNWENLSLQSVVLDFGNNHLYQFLFGCALLQSIEEFSEPKLDTYTNVMIGVPYSFPIPIFSNNSKILLNQSNKNKSEIENKNESENKHLTIEDQLQKRIIKYRQCFYKYKGEIDEYEREKEKSQNNDNVTNNFSDTYQILGSYNSINNSFDWKHEKDEKPIFIAEYICNQSLNTNEIIFDGLPDIDDDIYKFYVHCPHISKFLHNFESGKTPFRNISLETDDFL